MPDGLHDSRVSRIEVDYEQRRLNLNVAVWLGSMDSDTPERRKAYKRGQILISGLLLAVTEPPDPRYPFRASAQLTIDGCNMSKNVSTELTRSLPADAFFRSLWVNEWNAFIHIAAKSAELMWLDRPRAQGSEPEARS